MIVSNQLAIHHIILGKPHSLMYLLMANVLGGTGWATKSTSANRPQDRLLALVAGDWHAVALFDVSHTERIREPSAFLIAVGVWIMFTKCSLWFPQVTYCTMIVYGQILK